MVRSTSSSRRGTGEAPSRTRAPGRPRPEIRVGDAAVPVDLPEGWDVTYVPENPSRPLTAPDDVLRERLARPRGTPPLRELARGRRSALVVVPDVTRPGHETWIMPLLIDALEAGGIEARSIRVVVGSGLHRPLTGAERRCRLGSALARGCAVLDHDAADRSRLVDLGSGPGGMPLTVNALVREADLVLATGVVEPHQFAGFSGGYKTVSIGLAGEDTIAGSHAPAFLAGDGVSLGRIDGNPFQDLVREIGRRAGVLFCVNTVLDGESRVVALDAGAPDLVHDDLAGVSRRLHVAKVDGAYDLVIAGVPAPKDSNLYQASRAVTYLQLGRAPLVRAGGTMIVAARCPEGAGRGLGERRFAEILAGEPDPARLVARAIRDGLPGGGQRAWFLARVLSMIRVVFVHTGCPDEVHRLGIGTAADVPAALEAIGAGPASRVRALVVRDPFRTLPIKGPSDDK